MAPHSQVSISPALLARTKDAISSLLGVRIFRGILMPIQAMSDYFFGNHVRLSEASAPRSSSFLLAFFAVPSEAVHVGIIRREFMPFMAMSHGPFLRRRSPLTFQVNSRSVRRFVDFLRRQFQMIGVHASTMRAEFSTGTYGGVVAYVVDHCTGWYLPFMYRKRQAMREFRISGSVRNMTIPSFIQSACKLPAAIFENCDFPQQSFKRRRGHGYIITLIGFTSDYQ